MSTDYTITTETTRVIVLRLTEQQAHDLIDGNHGLHAFQVALRAALGEEQPPAPRPSQKGWKQPAKQAADVEREFRQRQARQAEPAPEQPRRPKATAPVAVASTKAPCDKCGRLIAPSMMSKHQRSKSCAPATADTAASSD